MRLLSLEIRSFGCVERAKLELGPGLNVLYGPNDLGKSTLAHAVRAVLLLPASHREAQGFVPWHRDAVPEVALTFSAREDPDSDQPPRIWRVRKAFGGGRKAQADLQWSNDGQIFGLEQKGSGVDAKLRQMLGWGVPEARARGPRGFPNSFLATVLLGPQATPGSLLGQGLSEDSSESGRERLTEALQALAQDPRFKSVLDHAQGKVDEAFTPTGKARTGKRSPLSSVRTRIDTLTAELRILEAQVHDSDDVRVQLLQLETARTEAVVARDEAERGWQQAHRDWERGRARAEAEAAIEQARAGLEHGRGILAERRTWQEAAQRHLEGRPASEAALARAREAEQAAAQALATAEAAQVSADEGGDAQARLARQALETRVLELRSEHERVHAQMLGAERVQALATEVETLGEQRDDLKRDQAAAEQTAAHAEAGRREAEAERRLYDAALELRRWQEAQRRVQAGEAAQAEAQRLVTVAEQAEQQAHAIDEALDVVPLPDTATVEQWRALAEERRVVEARLGVGLSLVVERSPATTLTARRDDAQSEAVGLGEAIEAQRTIALRLGADTELLVRGGDAQARAARDEVEQRWEQQVAPVLAKLEVTGLEALRERLKQAAQQRQQGVQLRAEAAAQRREAAVRSERAAELPALRQALEASTQALASIDREALEQRAGDHDEATLQRRRTQAEARIEESRHRWSQARAQMASLESQHHARSEAYDRKHAELVEARAQVSGEPEAVRDAAFDRLAAIEGEQQTIGEQLEALEQAHAQRRAQAETAVREARAHSDRVRRDAEAARRELQERREQLAQAEGRLAQLEGQAREIDEALLERAVTEGQQRLATLPAADTVVTAEALEQADTERRARQQTLREVQADLDQQRGALKQVGGAVAREHAERTREALEAAKLGEHDIELDYEAWRLLTETLREAETAEGRHLGQALGEPVHTRFATLTGGRYGALALGRDLEATGLEVAGGLRDVTRLSEGVQDQLATILRLAVAEQLDTALVLDDHLVQTDPGRVAWFCEVLAQVSARVQVVVLTCRPEDYLSEDQRPGEGEAMRDTAGLRAVDLTRVIQRA